MTWSDVSTDFAFVAAATTTQTILISLESPVQLNALGADPPEDLTILRMVGDFSVSLTTNGTWRLALLVQDRTWTAQVSGRDDNDKRILWSQVYVDAIGAAMNWLPPGQVVSAAGLNVTSTVREAVHLDIAPKVRIEPGKALYLVAYEEVNGAVLSVSSVNMRVLYKRSGRR